MFAEFIGKIKGKDGFYYRMSLASFGIGLISLCYIFYIARETGNYAPVENYFVVAIFALPIVSGVIGLFCNRKIIFVLLMSALFAGVMYCVSFQPFEGYVLWLGGGLNYTIHSYLLSVFPLLFSIVCLRYLYLAKFPNSCKDAERLFSAFGVFSCICAIAFIVHKKESFNIVGSWYYIFSLAVLAAFMFVFMAMMFKPIQLKYLFLIVLFSLLSVAIIDHYEPVISQYSETALKFKKEGGEYEEIYSTSRLPNGRIELRKERFFKMPSYDVDVRYKIISGDMIQQNDNKLIRPYWASTSTAVLAAFMFFCIVIVFKLSRLKYLFWIVLVSVLSVAVIDHYKPVVISHYSEKGRKFKKPEYEEIYLTSRLPNGGTTLKKEKIIIIPDRIVGIPDSAIPGYEQVPFITDGQYTIASGDMIQQNANKLLRTYWPSINDSSLQQIEYFENKPTLVIPPRSSLRVDILYMLLFPWFAYVICCALNKSDKRKLLFCQELFLIVFLSYFLK